MNDMNLMDELLKIPADATAATVQGIEMLLIDENKAGALLESDPNDNTIHECLLSNGRFLFQSDNANLVALYKVTGSIAVAADEVRGMRAPDLQASASSSVRCM